MFNCAIDTTLRRRKDVNILAKSFKKTKITIFELKMRLENISLLTFS